MVLDFPAWGVVVLWVLLGIAGLAIVWASTRSTLKGMDMVLDHPEEHERRQGGPSGRHDGDGRDGDTVDDDHDRGAQER